MTLIFQGEPPSSQYKGVYWKKENGFWQSYINEEIDIVKYLGLFSNEVAAANCYNYHAKLYFGEFAKLNECPYMSPEEWNSYRSVKNKTSRYRGVSLVNGKYLAQIHHDGKNIRIGSYNDEKEAALMYNQMAIKLKGRKARLNDMQGKL